VISELLKNEHRRSSLRSWWHLERDHASEVLRHFIERLRKTCCTDRDARRHPATGAADSTKCCRRCWQRRKAQESHARRTKATAEILNFLGAQLEKGRGRVDSRARLELAQRSLDQMFTFENLNALDDRAIQTLLREVQSESADRGLKAPSRPAEKIFKNMSSRASEMLREDLEAKRTGARLRGRSRAARDPEDRCAALRTRVRSSSRGRRRYQFI